MDETTWVLTSYLVSNAIVLPLSGFFSTLFGRKRFYMACVVIFTLSSMLCGLAPSLGMLIVFRILQGIGGGALQPVAQAILVESFPAAKARHGDGGVRHGRGGRAHHRADAGRLDHRQLQLALDLPDQYSGGRALADADLGDHFRSALPGAQDAAPGPEDRLHRSGAADHRAGVPRNRAGRRAAARLAGLAPDHGLGQSSR